MNEKRGWLDALAVYRNPKIVAMLFLGFSAGLPFLLVFATLSAWLTQEDIARGTIGLLSWVGITYSIKVFWAPVVDRLPLPILKQLLGRRRSWMLLAQIGLAAGLFGISNGDPAENLSFIVWCALGVAFSSATQDIAIDAWRIESAPKEDQGAMAAAYQLGYRIALIVAGAGALWMASELGWQTAYFTMACLIGIGIVTTLLVAEPQATIDANTREREHQVTAFIERNAHLPQWMQDAGAWFVSAVISPFLDFFQRNGLKLGLIILAFVGLFRVTDIAMGVMANPFYLDLGYSLKEVAAVAKGYGVVMTIIGAILGGIFVARYGAMRSLIIGGIMVILTNLTFALLALGGEPKLLGLVMVISADNFSAGFAGSAFIAYLSGLTNPAYTATQYALFSSLFTLPGKIIAGFSGFVVEAKGYPFFFVYTSLLGIPALFIIFWLSRHHVTKE